MQIDRDIERYVIDAQSSLRAALEKLSKTNLRILFVVDSAQKVKAAFTDGDLRRWLLVHQNLDLGAPISAIANPQFVACSENLPPNQIADLLSERITHVPLLAEDGRVVAVASLETRAMSIGEHSINSESPCFVIAEIGNNHNGSLELGKRLIEEAAGAGADCVKFQMRDLESLYSNRGDHNDPKEDLGSQYVLDLLSKFQLSLDEFVVLFQHAKDYHVVPMCTPFDLVSVGRLEELGVPAYKTASADLTNHELLACIAEKNKPMLCSTGMSSEDEILGAVGALEAKGARFVLLHCNSTYPAPFRDINLNYMSRLRKLGGCFVGYSGHERGIHVPVAAVALGAKVIEKHFTLDKSLEGNDHKVSLVPDEFKLMVDSIREVEESLGKGEVRHVSQGERLNREVLGKSLVVNRRIPVGETIEASMVDIRSPGKGLPPYRRAEVVGLTAIRDFERGDFLYQSDIDGQIVLPRNYEFSHRTGVPVRYHDFRELTLNSNLSFIEFHLSYKDLDATLGDYFDGPSELDFVVHAPELFEGDHTLDLCAADPTYRERSKRELQRVIDLTQGMKKLFPGTERPMIVVNVGGFTADRFVSDGERAVLYARLGESLADLNTDGVELIPQTMPPYPWHFGGQRYHNLFMDADETVEFCLEHSMRICFDIAHSKLACNEFEWDFSDFVSKLGPYTAHLHISDCRGTNDEGLQIGEGDIDFKSLMIQLTELAPNATWLPEIWQGHKNSGAGFWTAFERLEKFEPELRT